MIDSVCSRRSSVRTAIWWLIFPPTTFPSPETCYILPILSFELSRFIAYPMLLIKSKEIQFRPIWEESTRLIPINININISDRVIKYHRITVDISNSIDAWSLFPLFGCVFWFIRLLTVRQGTVNSPVTQCSMIAYYRPTLSPLPVISSCSDH